MASGRGEEAVGCRVQVYWEGESEWFDGVVGAFSPSRGYFVQYDDGEEQWEVDVGEDGMRFLPKSGNERDNPTTRSSHESEHDEHDSGGEYSDAGGSDTAEDDQGEDQEHEEDVVGPSSSVASPSHPESEEDQQGQQDAVLSPCASKTNRSASEKQQRPTAAYMRSSAAFFRDEETLRELRHELRREKKALTNQVHTLKLQVAEKETASATLKQELQQLKTHMALNSIIQHRPISRSPRDHEPAARTTARSKTPAQWSECVLDRKLQNQHLTQELLVLKTSVQDKQTAVERKRQQCEQLRARLARVPRRHLCSLVELQVEIARLLEEKRDLQTRSPSSNPDTMTPTAPNPTSSSSKAALQAELAGLEATAEHYKEELRQWQLKHDCEQARLEPMEARLASLQQQLRRYEDSQVLLRSVFLRLKPSSHDGRVPLNAALAAFETLAPPEQSAMSADVMTSRLQESKLLPTVESGEQQVDFSQFVAAFTHLFKS